MIFILLIFHFFKFVLTYWGKFYLVARRTILIIIMLFIGYNSAKWFNLGEKKSITVAIESGIQNATVGIIVGNLILNQESGISILSLPSGVYGILMYLVCLPFVFWFLKQ